MDELDDAYDDDEPVSNLLPPDDRLWRHPSEVATHPWPAPFPFSPPQPRVWTIAVLVGVISSLLTAGLIAVAGGFRDREVAVRSVEREVASPVTLRTTAAGANVAEIAERVRSICGDDRAVFFDMPRVDVSSTLVRERVAAGRPIRYLVPDKVANYIGAQALYRASAPAGVS